MANFLRRRKSRTLLWLPAVGLLLAFFQNCSGALMQSGESFSVGMASTFSGSCEADLMNLYQRTYFPLLTRQCRNCHVNGPGVGKFASSDFQTSFTAFQNLGRERVEDNAVNPSHQPPYTGSINQEEVNAYRPQWVAAEAAYADCATRSPGGGGVHPVADEVSLTIHKSDPRILSSVSARTWTRLEWDLETEIADASLRGKLRLIVGVEARVAIVSGARVGYEFREPFARLKSGVSGPLWLQGLHIGFNDQVQSQVTTYKFVNIAINSTSNVALSPGSGFALLATSTEPVATDRFALGVSDIVSAQGVSLIDGAQVSLPNPPPGGGTGGGGAGSVTFTTLTSTDPTQGIFRNSCFSCHSGSNIKGGLDLSNYSQARARGANILSRMNSTSSPMPTAGLLRQADRDLVRAWVDAGYPQ